MSGNDGINEEGICELVQALTVNTFVSEDFHKDGHLVPPERCGRYATHHHRRVARGVSWLPGNPPNARIVGGAL